MRHRWKTSNTNYALAGMSIDGIANLNARHNIYTAPAGAWTFLTEEGGAYATSTYGTADTSYHLWEDKWLTGSVVFNLDGIDRGTLITYIPQEALKVFFRSPTLINNYTYVNWIFLSNYVYPEPAFSVWGAWENAPTGHIGIWGLPAGHGLIR